MAELKEILPEAFEKRIKRAGIVNAWNDANFKKAVENTKRKNLIMAGVTTDVCLVYPAIAACREGYNVQAVMDASGSPFDISNVRFVLSVSKHRRCFRRTVWMNQPVFLWSLPLIQ